MPVYVQFDIVRFQSAAHITNYNRSTKIAQLKSLRVRPALVNACRSQLWIQWLSWPLHAGNNHDTATLLAIKSFSVLFNFQKSSLPESCFTILSSFFLRRHFVNVSSCLIYWIDHFYTMLHLQHLYLLLTQQRLYYIIFHRFFSSILDSIR